MEKKTNNEGKIRNISLFAFPRLLSFQLNGHRRAETVVHVATTQTLQKNERKQKNIKKKQDPTTRRRGSAQPIVFQVKTGETTKIWGGSFLFFGRS
jgi:hypothetical protein